MGLRNWRGERFTGKRVGGIRRRHGLPNHIERQIKRLREKGFGSAWEVAAQLSMNERVVRRLGKAGDPRVERVIVPAQSRRTYCMYRANLAAMPARSSGD